MLPVFIKFLFLPFPFRLAFKISVSVRIWTNSRIVHLHYFTPCFSKFILLTLIQSFSVFSFLFHVAWYLVNIICVKKKIKAWIIIINNKSCCCLTVVQLLPFWAFVCMQRFECVFVTKRKKPENIGIRRNPWLIKLINVSNKKGIGSFLWRRTSMLATEGMLRSRLLLPVRAT